MTESMMNIPPTIRVGYQNRNDTYTNKLAYVIYYDEKGVLRKEKSWEGWRDKKLAADDFKNEPTSGFVLNKKVGDYKSDWNHRSAAVRVYDPRGFEFEIGVENLLYILQECTSTKGKGLEGDFVYAWDRSDLVLLPTSAQEFVSSRKFTDMKIMKVGKKDMKEGCVYITKNMENVLYLGHHEVFEYKHDYSTHKKFHQSQGKKHVFRFIGAKKEKSWDKEIYWFQDGFTKLASKVSDQVSSDFADEYDAFKQSLFGSKCNKVVIKSDPILETQLNDDNYYGTNRIMKIDDRIVKVSIRANWDYKSGTRIKNGYYIEETYLLRIDNDVVYERSMDNRNNYGYHNTIPTHKLKSISEILALECYNISLVNDHGKTIEI